MDTEKIKQAITLLDATSCIEVLHECAERLGLVSVDEAVEILCVPKRTLYQRVKDGKMLTIEMGNKIFVCIND